MFKLDQEESELVDVVARFVDREVRPKASDLERRDAYPGALIDEMKSMGLFGLAAAPPYAPAGISTTCFAAVSEELARGWMSLSGALGGHSVVIRLLQEFGTEVQKDSYLPRLVTGEVRATMALTEPSGGSDLQAMRTTAVRDGSDLVLNGEKMWITNAIRSDLLAVLCKTDETALPPYRGMSIVLVEKVGGVDVGRPLSKLGYKGVETCPVSFTDARVPATNVLGDTPGRGFAQMMRGLEYGRIQVAARATGVGRAALAAALEYAQERTAFGKPIWQHQSIGNYLADMVTQLNAARLLIQQAAEGYDRGDRSDMEAGMAKLFASEMAMDLTNKAIRIHGGYGYSSEYEVERLYRDAPLMALGEGTNEIQRNVIVRQLIERSYDHA